MRALLLLLLFPFHLAAQQSDPFDLCVGYTPAVIDATHKIPNPSFEEHTYCPTGVDQMDAVVDWVYTNTPDYFNTCGYIHGNMYSHDLVPFADGDGAIGLWGNLFSDFREYVGVCLRSPLEPGRPYRLSFHNFLPIDCSGAHISVFGHSVCGGLPPVSGGDCLADSPGWSEIGTVFIPVVPGGHGWGLSYIDLVVTEDIQFIMLGVACDLNCLTTYIYLDDLRLEEVYAELQLEAEGHACSGDLRLIAEIDASGGEWQWFLDGVELPGETGSTLDISGGGYGSGTYSVRYVWDDYCAVEQIDVDADTEAEVECSAVDDLICPDGDAVLLVEGSPGGGIFSGPGVQGGYFDPSVVGPGLHEIIYTAYDDYGCSGTCVMEIEVRTPESPVCPPDLAVCVSADDFELSAGIPGGGVFSGPGVMDGWFSPVSAGLGSHVITYTVADRYGCAGTCTFIIEATPPSFLPGCPDDMIVCPADMSFELTGGLPAGGVFSGAGVTDSWFSPGSAGVGSHELSYTVADADGCEGTCLFTIEVQDTVDLVCPDGIYVCGLEAPFLLTGESPAGGWYEGAGVGFDIFYPVLAGYGDHEITYFYEYGICIQHCIFTIHVRELPEVDCPADRTVCVEDGDFALPAASLPGGAYSGPGVSGGIFSPSSAGLGVHVIRYSVFDQYLCEAVCSFVITVSEEVAPVCPADLSICLHGGEVTLSGGSPSGGEYSGPGVSGGVFDPAETGAGVFAIRYSTESQSCGGVCSFEIVVSDELAAACGELGPVCVDGGMVPLPGSTPSGGVYTGPGVSGGSFDPAAAGVGVHTLTYEAADAAGCRYRCSLEVEVLASPVVDAPADATVCIGSGELSLSGGSPSGGVYSGPGVSGDRFDPAVAGIGVHALSYSYSDAAGCRASDRFLLTVVAVPSAGADIDLRCHEVDTAYLSAQGVGQWTFSGENAGTAEISDATAAAAKVYGFSGPGSYVLVWESLGCRDSVTIAVGDDCDCILLGNYIETAEQLFCASAGRHILTGWDPTPSGGVYRWEWSDDGMTWLPAPGDGTGRDYETGDLGPGVYYFRRVYELPDEDDCYSESNVLRLEVVAPQTAGEQGDPPAVCVSSPQDFDLYGLLSGADGGGRWEEASAIPSTGGAFDAQVGGFDTDGQRAGVYLFRYIVSSPAPCGADTAEVSILVNEDPSSSIAVDPGEVLDCRIMGVTLRAGLQDHVVYSWLLESQPAGSGTELFVSTGGLYTLMVRDTLTGCTSMSEIRIRDESGYPFVYIADPEALTCARTSVELDASASQTGANIVHRWLDESGTVLLPGTLYLTVTAPGIYILESVDVLNGCMNRDTVEVLEDLRTPVVDAGPARTLHCGASETSLSGMVSGGSGAYDLRWESAGAEIISGGSTLTPGVRGAGRYYLYATDRASGCMALDSVEVLESMESIGVTLLEVPPVCAEEATGYIRIETDGEAPLVYELNGRVTTPSSTGRIDGLVPGSYRIRIRDARGCSVDTLVELRRLDPVMVQLPTRIVVDGGDTVHVVATVDRPVQALRWIRWEPGEDISCDTCLEVRLWPQETREYELWVEDEWGCRGHGVVEVLVRRKIRVYIPEAFSPNGDGVNDGFTLYGPDIWLIRRLEVFDRWGDGVFSKADFRANEPEEGWLGRFRDREMNPAVFVYVAEVELLDGHLVRFHGEVQLVR